MYLKKWILPFVILGASPSQQSSVGSTPEETPSVSTPVITPSVSTQRMTPSVSTPMIASLISTVQTTQGMITTLLNKNRGNTQ